MSESYLARDVRDVPTIVDAVSVRDAAAEPPTRIIPASLSHDLHEELLAVPHVFEGDGVDLGVDDDARGVDKGVGVGVASVNGRRVSKEKFTFDAFARRERPRGGLRSRLAREDVVGIEIERVAHPSIAFDRARRTRRRGMTMHFSRHSSS